MEIMLLGTAAAEAWPAPFCRCDACGQARLLRGKDIRTRSGALIDGVVKVDFGPDTCSQMQREGLDLGAITTLVFTHAHDDHFIPAELQYRKMMFVAGEQPAKLHVYGNTDVMAILWRLYEDPEEIAAEFHEPFEPFVPVETHDGTLILPLPAAHVPGAFLLCLERGGKSVLYGHDTGTFPYDTVRALAGIPLDLLLLDCTYGATDREPVMHMGLSAINETVDRLRAVGAVTADTKLVATHISHNSGLLHDQLAGKLESHGIDLAYDGLTIQLT